MAAKSFSKSITWNNYFFKTVDIQNNYFKKHIDWEANWHTIITVLAWLCLLKGIYLIVYPEPTRKTSTEARVLSTPIVLIVIAIICAIGLFLAYTGR